MCWTKGCIWIVLGVVMLAAAPASGGETTLSAQADAYLSYANPNTNYGGATSLRVGYDDDIGYGQIRNTVIRFNLSGIPSGVPIVRATLGLYCYDTDMGSDDDYLEITWGRLTAEWPLESQVTWNHRRLSTPTLWWTGTYLEDRGGLSDVEEYDFLELEPQQVGWILFEAKGIVEYWITYGEPNYGFLLWASDGMFEPSGQQTIALFYSKESTDPRKPYLFIEWDNTPPTPNPMTFATPPAPTSTSAITMTATEATDSQSPPVWYFFNFVSGGSGGNDSVWQLSRNYTDTGLAANTSYTYRVKARDSAHPDPLKCNETQYSTNATTVTHIETPTGVSFGTVTTNLIEVTAPGTFTNLTVGSSGLYFEWRLNGVPVGNSGWVQTTTTTASGLAPNTTYTFQVKARNQNAVQTDYSPTAAKVTLANVPAAPTLANPTPTTMTLDVNPNGNPPVTVFAIKCTGAVPNDPNWVDRYVSAAGLPSGAEVWQTDAAWGVITVKGLQPATTYTFAVKARNQEGVETAFGPGASLTTLGPQAEHDLGDAPDSTNSFSVPMTAYPAAGVPANFPTVYGGTSGMPPYGPIHLAPKAVAHLGANVTLENEADIGLDEDPTNNIIPLNNAANLDGGDDGVQVPLALPHCQRTTFDYIVTVATGAISPSLYVNVWFDWNRDGDWDDILTCPEGSSAPEWAVQNQIVSPPGPGQYTFTTPPFLPWHPTVPPEYIWMRITLSERPWMPSPGPGSGGSGPATGYEFGETEDFFFVPKTLQDNEACCFAPNGNCIDLPPADCMAQGGTPQGPGTVCGDRPPIACCVPNAAGGIQCLMVDPLCCDDIGGFTAFSPTCLGDLNGNGIDDACEPPPPLEPKWMQWPHGPGQGFDAASGLWWYELVPPPIEVNKVVADDFISDGRPVRALDWYGSYFDERYAPMHPPIEPFVLDGWFISFHHDGGGPPQPCPPPAVANDPSVLAVYFAPVEAVRIQQIGDMWDCFNHYVYRYSVDLSRCCLICTERDPRLPDIPPPGQPDGFHEVAWMRYWLDIQAVVGVKWIPPACSYEGLILTGHLPSNQTPDGHFWGWHTSPEVRLNEACMGRIVDFTPYPSDCWEYGNWVKQPWLCPPPVQPVNMAFGLYAPPCSPMGDVNGDGALDVSDINCFVRCLLGGAAPGCWCRCADMNNDGATNGLDIQLFVDALLAP